MNRVEGHVENTRQQKQDRQLLQQRVFQLRIGSIEEDVGIELALEIDEGHPEKIGGRIAEGVARLLGKRQFLSVQLHES
jgi:uncharacterized membrane protein